MKLYFAAAGRALRLLMRADPGLQTAHGLRLRVRPAGPARVVEVAGEDRQAVDPVRRRAQRQDLAELGPVVERLGGETFLYTQLADGQMLVIQADGEIPTRVHEKIAVKLNPVTCHLFDGAGLAVERAERHPLADVRRMAGRKAS